MILHDVELERLCREEALIVGWEPELINPASIDVRLGDRVMVENPNHAQLEITGIDQRSKADPFWLQPGGFVLAETIEIFNMPEDVAGQFVLKSSRAREGLSHALAGYLDPGWCGSRLTLELHNIRKHHAIPLWPGLRIGQIVCHRMEGRPRQSYSEIGHYNNQPQVMPSWETC